jgi:hypothetical protein
MLAGFALSPDRRQPLFWEGVILSGDIPTAAPVWLGTRPQVDDSVRKVLTAADVANWRAMATYYIWGFTGIPNWQPLITHNVASPITSCPNLSRVDFLSYTYNTNSTTGLAIAVHLYAWHFIPASGVKNRVVLYSPGHSVSFDDGVTVDPDNSGGGDWRMITSLVAAGFDVFVYDMPAYFTVPGNSDGTGSAEANWYADTGTPVYPYVGEGHEWLFALTPHVRSVGSTHRFFLTMPALCISYAQLLGRFSNYSIVGLSGGGWSSTFMAALDTRISKSYSVAGSQPLYMRPATNQLGDAEQVWPEFYRGCGYLDLYLMATHNRHHEQIYNQRDDTAFGATQYAAVESGRVRCNGLTYSQAIADWSGEITIAAAAIGSGTFSTLINNDADHHCIPWAVVNHIISDLG